MTKWAVWAVVVDGTKLSAEIYSIAFSDKALLAIAAASDHQLQRLIHLSIYRFHLSVSLCSRVAYLAAPSDTNEHHLNTVMCVYTCVYALARRDARVSECVCVSVCQCLVLAAVQWRQSAQPVITTPHVICTTHTHARKPDQPTFHLYVSGGAFRICLSVCACVSTETLSLSHGLTSNALVVNVSVKINQFQ